MTTRAQFAYGIAAHDNRHRERDVIEVTPDDKRALQIILLATQQAERIRKLELENSNLLATIDGYRKAHIDGAVARWMDDPRVKEIATRRPVEDAHP